MSSYIQMLLKPCLVCVYQVRFRQCLLLTAGGTLADTGYVVVVPFIRHCLCARHRDKGQIDVLSFNSHNSPVFVLIVAKRKQI